MKLIIVSDQQSSNPSTNQVPIGKPAAHYSKADAALVVDLHDTEEAASKRDESTTNEKTISSYNNDVILYYSNIYKENSTIVADFSKGESEAKLYIYPKKKSMEKKSKVLKSGKSEKRSREYLYHKLHDTLNRIVPLVIALYPGERNLQYLGG